MDAVVLTEFRYVLANPDWRFDAIPEIMDGKNVFDFWSPDIDEKLMALEREELLRLRRLEEELLAQGPVESLTAEQQGKLKRIREKRTRLVQHSRMKKAVDQPAIPRSHNVDRRTFSELSEHLSSLGMDGESATRQIRERASSRSKYVLLSFVIAHVIF